MILKSIKWRLQLWYGLVLLAVLLGFGVTAYQLERGRQFRRVDDELHRRITVLMQALHRPHGPPAGRPHRENWPPLELPGEPPTGREEHASPFKLPPPLAALFEATDPTPFYFIIRGRDGSEIARSTNAPAAAVSREPATPPRQKTGPPQPSGDADQPPHNGEPRPEPEMGRPGFSPPQPTVQMDGNLREMTVLTPSDEFILVGRNVTPEVAELHLAGLKLAGFGGIILFIGLAGGWALVGRALRPISEISATAAKISAGDLSQRINLAEAESELGRLAAVLNSTFARLETAFAQQKQFASDAAHELRTPVSVILTQAQTSLARERDAASYRQTVEACQRAAQRMRRLIGSLLELTRFDAGQEVLQRVKFDLAKTVADCAALVQPLAEERQVKIRCDLQPLNFTGDPDRLAQVATNLLTNAIQFNRPGGEVRVKLEAPEGLAVLEIADTGAGIAARDLPHVFERFYRADKSRTGAGSSGLGLAICQAIVRAHGGAIEAASVEPAGATFTVRLPRAA